MENLLLSVTDAAYLVDYKIRVSFNDGVEKQVDLSGELSGAVFEPLRDLEKFKNFSLSHNTIEWENGADFAPEFLYTIGA